MYNFQMNFGNPSSFADWRKYSGFDPNKSFIGGVAPPNGATSPIAAPSIQDIGKRFSEVGSQLSSGNFMNAANVAMTGKVPAGNPVGNPVGAVATVPVATVGATNSTAKDLNGDGMISEWEEK